MKISGIDNIYIVRLLSRNISISQIIGYAVSYLVGLTIVLTAIAFYNDVTATADGSVTEDYYVISKKVSGLNTLMGNSVDFSESEINKLKSQDWVAEVGRFTASDYSVYASIDLGFRSFSTMLFFESVDDTFLDIKPHEWTFSANSNIIPIILSKDYLTLYNFGFAASRSLPQLSESLVKQMPIRITISGNGMRDEYHGRIVGFSSRLNTIAVPESFMDYANEKYGSGTKTPASRLVLKVSSPGSPEITEYFTNHNYEIAGDKAGESQFARLLSIITVVIIIIGAVISLLSFFILLLSIYLLLQKNREKLNELILLGYSPVYLSKYYSIPVITMNYVIYAIALLITVVCRSFWHDQLQSMEMATGSILSTVIIGFAIVTLLTIISIIAIRRNCLSTTKI